MKRFASIVAVALLAGCQGVGDVKTENAQKDAEDAFASAAFARLQTLAGKWKAEITSGPAAGAADATSPAPAAAPAAASASKPAETMNVEYLVTSGGHALLEKLFAGSGDEMVTMYYLEGTDLVLVHYCAMGNRPHMRLDRKSSTRDDLHFAFDVHATDVDPKKDAHVHEGRVHFVDADHVECEWAFWADGKESGRHTFTLKRSVSTYTAPKSTTGS